MASKEWNDGRKISKQVLQLAKMYFVQTRTDDALTITPVKNSRKQSISRSSPESALLHSKMIFLNNCRQTFWYMTSREVAFYFHAQANPTWALPQSVKYDKREGVTQTAVRFTRSGCIFRSKPNRNAFASLTDGLLAHEMPLYVWSQQLPATIKERLLTIYPSQAVKKNHTRCGILLTQASELKPVLKACLCNIRTQKRYTSKHNYVPLRALAFSCIGASSSLC